MHMIAVTAKAINWNYLFNQLHKMDVTSLINNSLRGGHTRMHTSIRTSTLK